MESNLGEQMPQEARPSTCLVVVKQQIVEQRYNHKGCQRAAKRTSADPEAAHARQQGHRDGSRVSVSAQISH